MTAENLSKLGSDDNSTKVSLEILSKMTGFPVEMINDEIFKGQEGQQEISLEDLRSAMLNYIDSTILNK